MTSVPNTSRPESTGRLPWRIAASWLAVVVWAGCIFYMSAHTGNQINHGMGIISSIAAVLKEWQLAIFGPGVDAISTCAHFCEYTVLGALLANALRFHMSGHRALVFAIAVAVASLYGVSDEVHQLFVPTRMCDPVDWVVDTLGATLGSFLVTRFLAGRQK